MAISETVYRDLDFNLRTDNTKDFNVLNTQESIRQSILNLILTPIGFATKFEKPTMGSGLNDLLSERPSRFVALQIRDQIELTIENYESRVKINKISVEYNLNTGVFIVSMTYYIKSLDINDELVLDLDIIQ